MAKKFLFEEDACADLEELRVLMGLSTDSEVLKYALRLLQWAKKDLPKQKGLLAVVFPETGEVKMVPLPGDLPIEENHSAEGFDTEFLRGLRIKTDGE